jgi:uncharacterized membrane protein/nitrite reductase/ring-hydroxylating ferredoxin subunit
MRSKAVLLGHPLHPMLIPFPFAFLVGAFVFDAAGWLLDRPPLWTTGAYLAAAGIATALLAAVPGAIDLLYTVPPASSAKTRGAKHGVINLAAVALVAVGWWLRGEAAARPELTALAIEGAGVALLGLGAFMGGTLVNRNLIGVEHRYARAGKWREQTVETRPGQTEWSVPKNDALEVDQMKLLHVGDKRIVLVRTEKGYVAFDDRCTHRGGSLAAGVHICGTVQCLWHGSQFDTSTGAVKAGPATNGIRTYRVRENGDTLTIVAAPGDRA